MSRLLVKNVENVVQHILWDAEFSPAAIARHTPGQLWSGGNGAHTLDELRYAVIPRNLKSPAAAVAVARGWALHRAVRWHLSANLFRRLEQRLGEAESVTRRHTLTDVDGLYAQQPMKKPLLQLWKDNWSYPSRQSSRYIKTTVSSRWTLAECTCTSRWSSKNVTLEGIQHQHTGDHAWGSVQSPQVTSRHWHALRYPWSQFELVVCAGIVGDLDVGSNLLPARLAPQRHRGFLELF
jgi:hypothetical protein